MADKPFKSNKKVLILGIGNVLWADEGFGVRCVEALNEQYQFEDNVRLMDGGTQGIYLVQHVQEADVLVVFDAIDYGLKPGTLKKIYDDQVPKFMGAKQMSLHQTGFQEVLAMAEFTGNYPESLLLIGCQPVELEDFGGSLREPVRAQISPSVDIALEYLAKFGVTPTLNKGSSEGLSPEELTMQCYESGRPSEGDAFRKGDPRFMNKSEGTD
ncbi:MULTISPECIES: HyaD/HybD family hydrogenase maturation endopeptidase [unclassified Neptuniibacter]|uniref:HyaD/HybD family hydrogenase maturation endopeptidase n=1 Tax=unclassified Neptuniibacter TaxID=2630693 RepID=UPI000C35A804|nr:MULTISPECIES: HyaD/HybD family hydrogenase maturation endopeptidase [unclassified Neptuniibacter]MAY42579.1 HyaD/HybD family hydrogenase maturation endopeptidase [Oceanospirillaceae bacterium]